MHCVCSAPRWRGREGAHMGRLAQAAVMVVWFGYGAHRRTRVMGLPAAASFSGGRGARLQIFKLYSQRQCCWYRPDPGPHCFRLAKMTYIKEKRLRNVLVCSAGCCLLRAGGFSCSLDVSPFELSKSPLPSALLGVDAYTCTVCIPARANRETRTTF